MKVEVYGASHSPWVQAVLLTLHEQGIDYEFRQLPPLETFLRWGVYMPTASIDGAPWKRESTEIIAKLGMDPISSEDLKTVKAAWQGVVHRPDNPFRLFAAFARDADVSTSPWRRLISSVYRGFLSFYMFTLINFVKLKLNPPGPEDSGDQFLVWESEFNASPSPFLDGEAPGSRDILLFGIIQCHSSIPVPPLKALLNDERLNGLRTWIANMDDRFKGFPHLYSGRYFEPKVAAPKPAGLVQQGGYCLGLLTSVVAFPISLALVIVLVEWARREPLASAIDSGVP